MSTSTPYCEIETTSSDSGYHSNLSGHCTSIDSSLPVDRSKFSTCRTPDTIDSLLDDVSVSSLDRKTKRLECASVYFRTRYIRTNLIEKEHVDFLQYLGEKTNHILIIKKILEHLSDGDLYSAANVSKTWKKIIMLIPSIRKKYRSYVRKLEWTKENRMVNNESSSCEDRNIVEWRATLTEIQNISKPLISSNSPRSSASPTTVSHRFEAYQTEAQRLKMGKRLFSCPKCKLPAHVDEKEFQTAVCTNVNCLYRFCILCHCLAHPSRMCNFISTPVVRKQACLVGTRTSKKNLKRLLL